MARKQKDPMAQHLYLLRIMKKRVPLQGSDITVDQLEALRSIVERAVREIKEQNLDASITRKLACDWVQRKFLYLLESAESANLVYLDD